MTSHERIRQLREMTQDLARLTCASIDEAADARASSLLATSAEVLEGVVRAFYHYETRLDEAWEAEEERETGSPAHG